MRYDIISALFVFSNSQKLQLTHIPSAHHTPIKVSEKIQFTKNFIQAYAFRFFFSEESAHIFTKVFNFAVINTMLISYS